MLDFNPLQFESLPNLKQALLTFLVSGMSDVQVYLLVSPIASKNSPPPLFQITGSDILGLQSSNQQGLLLRDCSFFLIFSSGWVQERIYTRIFKSKISPKYTLLPPIQIQCCGAYTETLLSYICVFFVHINSCLLYTSDAADDC